MNIAHVFIVSQIVILALCAIIPLIQAAGRSARERRAEREAEEQRAERERAATQRKAEAEAKRAETERRRAIRQQAAKAAREMRTLTTRAPHPSPAATPSPQGEGSTTAAPRRPIIRGNMAFRGQTVAFTGTLKGWTRAEAVRAVTDNGGRAYEDMPAGVTMLIVGDKPGKTKLDKARKWGVRLLTEQDFESYVHMPLTLTPNEFAAIYAA